LIIKIDGDFFRVLVVAVASAILCLTTAAKVEQIKELSSNILFGGFLGIQP
jgi:hypothetical protein